MEPIDPQIQLESIPQKHYLLKLVWLNAKKLEFEGITEITVYRGQTFSQLFE